MGNNIGTLDKIQEHIWEMHGNMGNNIGTLDKIQEHIWEMHGEHWEQHKDIVPMHMR